MKTSALSFALAVITIATFPASALVPTRVPTSSPTDLRVRKIPYEPDIITPVSARPDFETMISFAPGERIENVAVGDSTSWQVVPNKRSDLLFVKPVSVDAHTNMAVVTDQRTYLFELRSDDGAGPMMYILRFTYPEKQAEKQTATAVPFVTTAWQASGALALRPVRAYDDGHSVFLYWPKGNALPAVLAIGDKGAEEPLGFTARDDYLITEGVPAKILVRVGSSEAVLIPKTGARQVANQIATR